MVGHQHGELVTPDPGHQAADQRGEVPDQEARHRGQQLITGIVTRRVVDQLQPVDVDATAVTRRPWPSFSRPRTWAAASSRARRLASPVIESRKARCSSASK